MTKVERAKTRELPAGKPERATAASARPAAKEHQFKPGHSGNPKGRPKGAKNEATIWREVFNTKIAIREGGRTRKVSVLEAMILKYVERALKTTSKRRPSSSTATT